MKLKFNIKEFFKRKRKNENFILMIVLLVIVVVAINYIWKPKSSKKKIELDSIDNNQIIQVNAEATDDNLERKLEKILTKISGARKSKSSYFILKK